MISTVEQYSVKFIAVNPRTGDRIATKWTLSAPSKEILMRRLAIVHPGYELKSFSWVR